VEGVGTVAVATPGFSNEGWGWGCGSCEKLGFSGDKKVERRNPETNRRVSVSLN